MEDNNNNNNGMQQNNNKNNTKGHDHLSLAQIEQYLDMMPSFQHLSQEDNDLRLKLIEKYLGSFPPGYKFDPTDEELVADYLCPKIDGKKLPYNLMHEVNIYRHNPEYLAETYKAQGSNKNWYFFTSRDKKYKNGSRPNRRAGDGYWKATGADRVVKRDNIEIGFRKALVFYRGRPPKGQKTFWIMHEFRVAGDPKETKKRKFIAINGEDTSMRLDDYILCRIYLKPPSKNKPNEDDDEEGNERSPADAVDNDNSPKGDEDSTPPSDNNVNVYANDDAEVNNLLYGPSNDNGGDNGVMQNADNNEGKNVIDTVNSARIYNTGHNNGADYDISYHQTNYNSYYYNGNMYPPTYPGHSSMLPSTSNNNNNNNNKYDYSSIWSTELCNFPICEEFGTYADPSTSSAGPVRIGQHYELPSDELYFSDDDLFDFETGLHIINGEAPSMPNLLGPDTFPNAANMSDPQSHLDKTDDKVDVKPLQPPHPSTLPRTPTPPPQLT